MHQRAPPHLFGTKLPFCVRSLKEGESGGTNFLWPNALFPPPPPPPPLPPGTLSPDFFVAGVARPENVGNWEERGGKAAEAARMTPT